MTETGSMRTFLLMASCLVSSASGMYIDVDRDNFKCESRSVKAELTYLCNPDTICTVNGKTEYIEGTLSYYGLQDAYGATNEDSIVMDAHANIHMLAGYTHHQKLVRMAPVPICGENFEADENNQYGDCPADGSYNFMTSFEGEGPEPGISGWATTGYKGELVVNMYLNSTMQLVGRCRADMKTIPMGMCPSARHISIVCLIAATLYGIYTILKRVKPQWVAKLHGSRGNPLLENRRVVRKTVAPYKRKDNTWSTEEIVMV